MLERQRIREENYKIKEEEINQKEIEAQSRRDEKEIERQDKLRLREIERKNKLEEELRLIEAAKKLKYE